MANCANIFGEFNSRIRLTDDRRKILREKRNNLRKRVNSGYGLIKSSDSLSHNLVFQSQGSYVMDTIINPLKEEDQYDIDDGVYFLGELAKHQRPTPNNFHDWLIRSIEAEVSDDEIKDIIDKSTCVRVIYNGRQEDINYHVDLPIYYIENKGQPDLADKNDGWFLSNPVEFILWFENKVKSGFRKEFMLERELYSEEYSQWLSDIRKKDKQLRRIVRYLKAWGDFIGEMPPGIVMTILAGENYVKDDRDDISLFKTLKNIEEYLHKNDGKCLRPTTPIGEDLFKKYPQEKKTFFKNKLKLFIESATQALNLENRKSACLKWQKHLGDRFFCYLIKDEIESANTYNTAPIIKSDNSRSA